MHRANHPDNYFEAPEKRLEIDFNSVPGVRDGLCSLSRDTWSRILNEAHCEILSVLKNESCTAYLLSESSLFVYPHKIIIKTCGTTTLLNCVPPLLRTMEKLLPNSLPNFVIYSRKEFICPQMQVHPHCCFNHECSFLRKYFPNGKGYAVGSEDSDRYYAFVANYCEEFTVHPDVPVDQTLEVMMHDLDEDVMRQFQFAKGDRTDAKTLTKKSGIAALNPEFLFDEHAFDPCGYSVNALLGNSYTTIHVTPEPEFSYVSYETNARSSSYASLVKKVVNLFHPERFTISFCADYCHALPRRELGFRSIRGYSRSLSVTRDIDNCTKLIIMNFQRD